MGHFVQAIVGSKRVLDSIQQRFGASVPHRGELRGIVKDKWDLFTLSAPVPGANESLESIAPTREENNCTMPA